VRRARSFTRTLTISGVSALALGCVVDGGGRGSFGEPVEGDAAGIADGTGEDGEGDTGEADDGDTGEPANGDDGDDGDGGKAYVEEAKDKFPTYFDLHEGVIARTCTPFANVCHNNKEYPDLRTPQAMLAMLGNPCNLAEADENVINGCEPPGDRLQILGGANAAFESQIAFVELEDDGMGNVGSVTIHLEQNIPAAMLDPMQPETIQIVRSTASGMLTVGQLVGAATYVAGTSSITVADFAALPVEGKTLLEAEIRGGDPNKDGVFGSMQAEHMQELKPGDPWNSYLLQRLQGNVPGSPMPLANQPLSAAEIVAIACWIEGADDPGGDEPDATIDYDDCGYAAEFGEPDPDSGATLSGHVQPIFDARCATAGCHGDIAPAAGLDLTDGAARGNLLEVASTQNPEVDLVTPGNPTNSYLMKKLLEAGFAGVQMPKGADALSDAELDTVRLWISYGAPDD
jgi:hypothetical protein